MSKFCPRWVYMTIVAQACFDYIKLNLGAGLLVISNKYDDGLKEIYEDKDLPKVDELESIGFEEKWRYIINRRNMCLDLGIGKYF